MRVCCVLIPTLLLCILPIFAEGSEEKTPRYPDKTKLLIWRDDEGKEHSVRNAADWAKRREHILANMQRVMGPLPGNDRKVPLDIKVVEEERTKGYVRKKIT